MLVPRLMLLLCTIRSCHALAQELVYCVRVRLQLLHDLVAAIRTESQIPRVHLLRQQREYLEEGREQVRTIGELVDEVEDGIAPGGHEEGEVGQGQAQVRHNDLVRELRDLADVDEQRIPQRLATLRRKFVERVLDLIAHRLCGERA